MKRVFNLKLLAGLIFTLFFAFVFAGPAHAYLDPGTGSLILQGLIAGIVAAGVAARLYWHRLLKLLGFRKDIDSDKK